MTHEGTIDVVLPLAAKDVGRLRTLGASMRKFWKVPGALHVFTPDVDWKIVAQAVDDCGLPDVFQEAECVADSELLHRPPSAKVKPGEGHWWMQQIVKIMAAERVTSSYYLVLDADCFTVRTIEYGDLIRNGRAIVGMSSDETVNHQFEASRPLWYEHSRRVLQIGAIETGVSVNVTPFVMSQALGLSLRNRLSTLYGPSWIGHLMMQTTAGDIHRACWTEYTLYELNARFAGLWDAFHEETRQPIIGNALWQVHQIPTWDARASFEPSPLPFYFSLVQSHTGLPPEWTWERVKPFLLDD